MHLAILKYHFPLSQEGIGGLEKSTWRIASSLSQKGHHISILCAASPENSSKKSSDPKISFETIDLCKWPGFRRIEQFDQFCTNWQKQNPQVPVVLGMDRTRRQTHIRAGNGVHRCFLKSRCLSEGFFKYASCLLNPLHRKILEIEKQSFSSPYLQKIIVNSYMVQREILDHYPVNEKKIEVIHNGVEWFEMEKNFSSWQQEKELFLKKNSLDPDAFHFLFIGNGYLRKGLKNLLKALSHLSKENFYLWVIGKDSHLKNYMTLAQNLHLEKKVFFLGPQKDVFPFYQLCDALVIPSFYDPFANVTIEALAMGLHVISSRSNGGHEILLPENGSLIEDLLALDSFVEPLKKALSLHRKTNDSSKKIRLYAQQWDFSSQLELFLQTLIPSSL